MNALVTAYRKRDGKRVVIPARWLAHKRLGKPYTTTAPKTAPRQPAQGQQDARAAGQNEGK